MALFIFNDMERIILHFYIPDFVIAAERSRNPYLKGRPVVILQGGSTGRAIQYMAAEVQKTGIQRTMPFQLAKRICPDIIGLPLDEPYYKKAFQTFALKLYTLSPIIEPYQYGQVFVDMSGSRYIAPDIVDKSFRFQKEIRSDLGLTSTIGIACNKMVSRIASQQEKNEIFRISVGLEARFMAPLDISYIPGLDPASQSELHDINIHINQELSEIPVECLAVMFGKRSLKIHEYSVGIDPSPVIPCQAYDPHKRPEFPQLEKSVVLPQATNQVEAIFHSLDLAIFDLAAEMDKRGVIPGRMEIAVSYVDQRTAKKGIPLPLEKLEGALPLAFLQDLRLIQQAHELLTRLIVRRVNIKEISLTFLKLQKTAIQLPLFPKKAIAPNGPPLKTASPPRPIPALIPATTFSSQAENPLKERVKIYATLQAIREKFGEQAIRAGYEKA